MNKLIFFIALGLAACGEEPAGEDLPVVARGEEPLHLNIPPDLMARARREARGLSRMPETLRRHSLEQGRERAMPSYSELRAHAADHAQERVSFAGHVGLVRPAGSGLWIAALLTRLDEGRWVDPLYVLSVSDVTALQGHEARVDGWVVGEREIGQHNLPLVIAFYAARED